MTKVGQQMITIVTAVEVAPGHENDWEQEWQTLREAGRQYPGFRSATLLRDTSQPTQYLIVSEWDGHGQAAEAMRELSWLKRGLTAPWAAGPTRVYDEVMDSVGDMMEADSPDTPK